MKLIFFLIINFLFIVLENQIIYQRKEINKNKIYNKSKNLSNLKIRNIINI